MAANGFFDVLVDQIIRDVRQEMDDLSANSKAEHSPVLRQDDLVSRLLAFRLRHDTAKSKSHPRLAKPASPKPERLMQIEALMGQSAMAIDTQAASPGFVDSAAEVAFQIIAKNGAKFLTNDFTRDASGHRILPLALKRERRRLLLSLHPDRHPESEQKVAHSRFLEVADAFTTLSELAMADVDDLAA